LKALNQVASQRMAKGDYLAAEELAAKGKEIHQFQSEVDALARRWGEVCGGDRAAKQALTPLWTYYQPILRALVTLGGKSSLGDLEAQVEHLISPLLQPADRAPMAGGRERWRAMIQRARKPLVTESWIEGGSGPTWSITAAGRQAAEKLINSGAGSNT
jgi:hypothetical protein